ncbi:MAG: 50S ribosomal protein L11 methyltransferase, partial [Bacteroidales bacterium]
TALDHDEKAVINARENIGLNGIRNIRIIHGTISSLKGHTFDVILGNITRNVILDQMQLYSKILSGKGILITSGFLTQDFKDIRNRALHNGLYPVHHREKRNWMVIRFIKKSGG